MSRTAQQMGRKKILILVAAVLLALALAGAAVAFLMTRGEELRYTTQSALREALPVTAAAELHGRGVRLAEPLKCEDLPGRTKERLRVSCSGRTSDDKPVTVLGSGERETAESHYTILVAGKPVVENASCLGADCHREDG